jgi:hypothetical protein
MYVHISSIRISKPLHFAPQINLTEGTSFTFHQIPSVSYRNRPSGQAHSIIGMRVDSKIIYAINHHGGETDTVRPYFAKELLAAILSRSKTLHTDTLYPCVPTSVRCQRVLQVDLCRKNHNFADGHGFSNLFNS